MANLLLSLFSDCNLNAVLPNLISNRQKWQKIQICLPDIFKNVLILPLVLLKILQIFLVILVKVKKVQKDTVKIKAVDFDDYVMNAISSNQ